MDRGTKILLGFIAAGLLWNGLGLTLARDILLAHDQEIHISLPAEGGTRISFRLPQA